MKKIINGIMIVIVIVTLLSITVNNIYYIVNREKDYIQIQKSIDSNKDLIEALRENDRVIKSFMERQ